MKAHLKWERLLDYGRLKEIGLYKIIYEKKTWAFIGENTVLIN